MNLTNINRTHITTATSDSHILILAIFGYFKLLVLSKHTLQMK